MEPAGAIDFTQGCTTLLREIWIKQKDFKNTLSPLFWRGRGEVIKGSF